MHFYSTLFTDILIIDLRMDKTRQDMLCTNYGEGGLQNGRGRHVKVYPYEKGGRKKF